MGDREDDATSKLIVNAVAVVSEESQIRASIELHKVAYVYDGKVLDASKMVVIHSDNLRLCSQCRAKPAIPNSDYCSYNCFVDSGE